MQHKWKVLIIVSAGVFMASLDLFIVNVAFPDIASDFEGSSLSSLSWVLNAYAIVYAALLIQWGGIADRFGRKRVFLGGLLTFIAGSALCGIAPSLEALIGFRLVQAVGAAAMIPTSLGLLLPEFSMEERPKAVAIWAAAGGVAAAAGPPLGGILVEGSWRLIFLVNVPFGLIAAWFAMRVLRESREEGVPHLPDIAGSLLLMAGIASLSLGLVQANDWGWAGAKTIASFAVAIAAIGAFVYRSSRHPAPVLDFDMLKVRSFSLANLSAMAFFAAFCAMLLGMVLFMTQVWGESILTTGLMLAPGPAIAAIFSVPSGVLGARVGQGLVAGAGNLIAVVGILYAAINVTVEPNYASALLPSLFLTGAGVGMTIPTLSGTVAASLPPDRFATGSAVLSTSRQIGAVLGIALFVPVLGTVDRSDPLAAFDRVWTLMIVLLLIGAVAAFAIGTVRPYAEPVEADESTPQQGDSAAIAPVAA